MPQLQNLTLTDRTPTTPVVHTFTPSDITGNVASVVESTGVPIGNSRVTLSLTRTAANKYKSVLKLTVPIVQTQTINGIALPTVVRTAYGELSFTFDQSSTELERNNVVGMMADALGTSKTLVNDTVVKLQGVY